MKPLLWAIGLGVASSLSVAQLRVENPKHLDYPEAKAKVLLSMACRVVAEEFHAQNQSEIEYPMTLVLGVKDEHWTEDESSHAYTLYLNDWNEAKFAVAAMRLALQRLITRDRRKRLTKEILRRSDQIAPVEASKLHGSRSADDRSFWGDNQGDNCFDGVREPAVRDTSCGIPIRMPH
jgi:hypothetical protein